MPEDTGKHRIPIVEEHATIEKQVVPTARVRIESQVEQRLEMLRDELVAQTVDIERVAVNREVDSPPDIRRDGDVLIIPVIEQRLVVQKRWFVTEELRVRRCEHREAIEVPVELRATSVSVERAEVPRQQDPATEPG